ncbi:unnamed protein product [Rotaria sordida]|uniref:Uncharacterized protein n=2 Tax=Rotaria sordida TaxID=392033 RepID=A0A815BRV9_9BILA|nr:unnamed protein product [Rotaria sordida]
MFTPVLVLLTIVISVADAYRLPVVVVTSKEDLSVKKQKLEETSEVKYIVVPNKHHTFWALAFLKEYPNSYLIATQGVKYDDRFNKYIDAYFTNNGLSNNTNCLMDKSIEWPYNEISYYCFYSVEMLYEVIFYHKPSSTLILTDLAFNYSELGEQVIRAEGYLLRFYLWLTDGYHQACVTKPYKYFFRKKIDLVKNDFDQLMSRYENFNRLIMAHGTVIPYDGYHLFKLGTYQFFMDLYNKEKQTKHKSSIIKKFGFVIIVGVSIFIISKVVRS